MLTVHVLKVTMISKTWHSIDTVKYAQEYFDFSLASALCAKRAAKFEVSFEHINYKLALLTYKVQSTSAPQYLCFLL